MGRFMDTPRRRPRVHDLRASDLGDPYAHLGGCDNPLPPRRCDGDGNLEVGTGRDTFGNWDTATVTCPGCPNCEGGAR